MTRKFFFFSEMGYNAYPEEEAQKYGFTALMFPNSVFDPPTARALWEMFLREHEYASEMGFDGSVCNEHHNNVLSMQESVNISAAVISQRINGTIALIGNPLPIHDNPVRVAEEIAMLDHISGGRVVSGFVRGIGWEYFNHGINPADSRERFNEAHDVIIRAWTSTEPFQWWGKHYEFRYVNVWPRTVQVPHPPIYIPGAGSTETMRYCAEKRYTFMSVYAPTSTIRRWFDGYRSACAELEYEPDPEKIAFAVPVYVAETHEQAHREARQHVEMLFHKLLKQGVEIVLPPGYMSESSLRGILAGRAGAFAGLSYEDLVDNDMVIVGSPESVTDQVVRLRDELGFGQIMALMCIADMPHYRVLRTMELFAKEVIPHFRASQPEREAALA